MRLPCRKDKTPSLKEMVQDEHGILLSLAQQLCSF